MIETKVGTFWIDSFVLLSVFPVYLFICSCELHVNETYDRGFCLNVIFHQHVFYNDIAFAYNVMCTDMF